MAQDAKLKNTQLPYSLKLCVGIQYKVTYNINLPDGIVNNEIGILKQIDCIRSSNCNSPHIKTVTGVWMEFTDPLIGRETREVCAYYMKENKIPSTWVPINYLKLEFKITKISGEQILRKMLPLKMAEAVTVHTSQGSTHPDVAVHRPEKMNIKLLYVACSCVTSLNGLYFTDHKEGFDVRKLRPKNIPGKKEIETLELKRPVHFYLHYLQDYLEYDTFIFVNIQSLPKYFQLITADKCFISSKCIFFVETWTLNSDQLNINNYKCVYRHDCSGKQRHPYGIMLYIREMCDDHIEIIYENNNYKPNKNNYVSHNIIAFTVEIIVSVLYIAVLQNQLEFLKIFFQICSITLKKKLHSSTRVVIVGDFNVDISENQRNKFLDLFKNSNFVLQLPTNSCSTDEFDCRYYENYFGYHKGITGILNKSKENVHKVIDANRIRTENISSDINNITKQCTNVENIISSCRSNSSEYINSENYNDSWQLSNKRINNFSNIDGVSCYANVVIQCLLNAQIICSIIHSNNVNMNLNYNENDLQFLQIMSNFLEFQYFSLSSFPLRQFVGHPFIMQVQQDAHEFIQVLFEKSSLCLNN